LTEADRELLVEKTKLETLQDNLIRLKESEKSWSKRHESELTAAKQQLLLHQDKIEAASKAIQEIERKQAELTFMPTGEFTSLQDYLTVAVDEERKAADQAVSARMVETQWDTRLQVFKAKVPPKPGDSPDCPTCGRAWDPKYLGQLQREYEQALINVNEAEASRLNSEDVADQYANQHAIVLGRKTEAEKMIREEKEKYSMLRDMDLAKHQREKFLQGKPLELQKNVDRLMLESNPHSDSVVQASKDLKAQRHSTTVAREKFDVLAQEHKDLLYWQQAYSKDMKLKLFAAACPYLDQTAAEHLKALENGQLHVQFSTVRVLASGEGKEDFNVRCWSDTGGEGFDSLSGGEQQMVSFAIGRALADLARTQTSGESKFQILDEPFSMLDERNSEAIVNYLQKSMTDGTTLLISNEEHLKGLITNRIHVVKRKGISEVE
jgi:DNA repair exonuclease SbcCD ATPase subunit